MATPRATTYSASSGDGVFGGIARPPDWDTGADAGTYNATTKVWTPGRGASGRVTAASWAIVPNSVTQWIEIAGTRMDALDSVVKAAIPGWEDRGGEDWQGVLSNWNGMAVDLRQGLERTLHAVGGGHYGSSNDGIYDFDLRKMQWGVELLPSDPAYWATNYKLPDIENPALSGSLTFYTLSSAVWNADEGNAAGVYGDEFYDPDNPTDPLRSSRRPTARHTYGTQVFVPELGTAGKLLMGCRRYWEYDLGTQTWATPKFPFGTGVGYSGATGYAGINPQSWFYNGRYWLAGTEDGTNARTWSCLPGGTDWQWHGGYPVGGYEAFHTAQERIGSTLWTLSYMDAGGGAYGRPFKMRETNLATGTATDHTVTLDSSFDGLTWTENDWDTMGMTWVPPVGKWLCLVNENTTIGNVWAWLDPATWTLSMASIAGAPAGDYRLENKVKWIPGFSAVVWINQADQNVRLLKP